VLINKDVFGITGGFLVRWKFNFFVVKWLKVAWLVDLSDMGYDMEFGGTDLGFCLILLGILNIGEGVRFLSWCVE
jgi:hypothetical protein